MTPFMFPGWSAAQLFESVSADELSQVKATYPRDPGEHNRPTNSRPTNSETRLITSGSELSTALVDIVRNAQDCLVAVGSRSREPSYLQEIEQTIVNKPELIHYRILICPPHSQVLKDHLLRLLELHELETEGQRAQRLHISIHSDPTHYYERFFVANEQAAVTLLPSAYSPMNFDTGLIVRDPLYVQGLLQHGKALYGRHRLESPEAVDELQVLE